MAKGREDQTPRARALAFLARGLVDGTYAPGQALRIADIADALRLSGTPVREALCRLAGARLVEDHHREGFRMARMTADEIASAYRLEADLYRGMADDIRHRGRPPFRDIASEATGTGAPPQAFARLQQRTGDEILRMAARDLGARLAPYRRHEADVLPAGALDLAGLDQALGAEDWPAFDAALRRYGRRRSAHAHRLHDASQPVRD